MQHQDFNYHNMTSQRFSGVEMKSFYVIVANHHGRNEATEYGGWVKIVKWFRLSHKSMGLATIERVTV